MKFIILSAMLLQVAYGQDACAAQFATAKTCMEAARPAPPAGAPNWYAIKAQKAACFTSNGCTDPSAAFETARACFKNVFETQVKPKLVTCMQTSFPGWVFPEHKDDEHHHGGPHHPGAPGGPGGKGGKGDHSAWLDQKVNTACNNDATKAATVKACVQALHPQGQDQNREAMRAQWQTARQAMETCKQSITQECKDKKHQQKAALCTCDTTQIQSDATIQAAFTACKPAGAPDHPNHGSPFCRNRGGKGGDHPPPQ